MELRPWMWKNKWSQKRLAKVLRITYPTIQRIIANRHTPSLYTALLLYEASNRQLDLFSLLTLEDKEKLEKIIAEFRKISSDTTSKE